jgi:hypothetical protein
MAGDGRRVMAHPEPVEVLGEDSLDLGADACEDVLA